MLLARKYEKGEGVPTDPSAAARLYRQGCDRMYASACDDAEYADWERSRGRAGHSRSTTPRARPGGETIACGSVWSSAAGANVVADAFQHALRAWSVEGLLWDRPALRGGKTVPKDLARAAGLCQKACEGGDADTCVRTGQGLYLGEGLPEEPSTRRRDPGSRRCKSGARPCPASISHPFTSRPGESPKTRRVRRRSWPSPAGSASRGPCDPAVLRPPADNPNRTPLPPTNSGVPGALRSRRR
jgi:TPR repeat protein